MPGINAAGMAIVPIEADGIPAYGFYFLGAHSGLENRQCGFGLGLLFAGCPAFGFPPFHAGRARASGTQPRKRPVARVAIFPFNLYSRTLRLVDPDMPWIDGVVRKFYFWSGCFTRDVFRNDADAFVAHTFVLHLNPVFRIYSPLPQSKGLQEQGDRSTQRDSSHERGMLFFHRLVRNRMQKSK